MQVPTDMCGLFFISIIHKCKIIRYPMSHGIAANKKGQISPVDADTEAVITLIFLHNWRGVLSTLVTDDSELEMIQQ
jgi:hypothetical protein